MSASNMNIRKRKVEDDSNDTTQHPVKKVSVKTKKSEEQKSEEKKSAVSNPLSIRTTIPSQSTLKDIIFIQHPITIDMLRRNVYITPALARVLYIYEDCMYSYNSIMNSMCNELKKYVLFNDPLHYECKEEIKFLLDNSPKADYFRSNLTHCIAFGSINKRISQTTVLQIIRTHIYDPEISGITNYVSPHQEPVAMTRELCNFLDIPSNAKYTRTQIMNKVIAYIKCCNLLKQDNLIFPDEKFEKVFMNNPFPLEKLNIYLRNHFLPNNVHHVELVKTDSNGNKFVEESFYRNSDHKKHGPYIKYFPNGKMKYTSYFCKDIEDGLHRTWYDNGSIKAYTQYNMGNMNRMSKLFDRDGTLLVDMTINKGIINKFTAYY
jgi:hypothetical protein